MWPVDVLLGHPLVRRAKRKAIGNPKRLPHRIVTGAIAVLLTVVVFGTWWLATSGVDPQASSRQYLEPLLRITTSTWFPVAILLVIVWRLLWYRRHRYAIMAANISGLSLETVKVLAAEATSPDGTRVVATNEATRADLRAKILTALETGEDERLSINPDAFSLDEDPATEPSETESTTGRDDQPPEDGASGAERPGVRARVSSVLSDPAPLRAATRGALGRLRGAVSAAASSARSLFSVDDVDDVEISEDEVRDPWLEGWKHAKMDLAATIDLSDLVWSIALPAGVVFVGILLLMQLWVQVWLYPVIAAVALLVGLGNYLRVHWQRTRRLESLREDSDRAAWSDTAAIVKAVERPETTMYYGWHAGKRYAHPDREVFARELAKRMEETLHGIEWSPSIMEKYAVQLEQLYPDLWGYRDDEKERVMNLLMELVEGSPNGILPKAKLIEDAIEHGTGGHWMGGRRQGEGHDPELVREAYRELVPAALVEFDLDLESQRETGEPRTVTAVRLRDDPLPPEYAAIRAQFESRFGNYADWEPEYELPNVADRLEEEPVYAGGRATIPNEVEAGV